MTRLERIKEHLPRHGTRFGKTQGGNPFAERGGKAFFGDDCAEQSLSDFLADKSLTGARMDDLLRSVDPNDEVTMRGLIAEVAMFAITTMTYDESVARKWRETFIDTEEE